MDIPVILRDLPTSDFLPRARAFADCVEALVDGVAPHLPRASAVHHHVRVIRNWLVDDRGAPYGVLPLWDTIQIYNEAILLGVPKEQLDALVALHLT